MAVIIDSPTPLRGASQYVALVPVTVRVRYSGRDTGTDVFDLQPGDTIVGRPRVIPGNRYKVSVLIAVGQSVIIETALFDRREVRQA